MNVITKSIATLRRYIDYLASKRRGQTQRPRGPASITGGTVPVRVSHVPRPDELHVVAVFFNFYRFKRPVENFKRFVKHMNSLGVTLHIVELVLRDMDFQVTDSFDRNHIQLRTTSEFFQKENLINIGVANIRKRYPNWKYMAWIDADVEFFNPNVIYETIVELNRHAVVQMWTRAIDLDPYDMPLEFKVPGYNNTSVVRSFADCYLLQEKRIPALYGVMWHPGYAWAMRRDIYEALNGLYENTILGAADHHMAWAFAGKPEQGIHGKASEGYKLDALDWCQNACQVVGGDLGVVRGLIHHQWHGRKANRKYVERWEILVDTGFDPNLDLRKESNGLLKLTGRSPELRQRIREYMQQRNDDANTIA